MPPSVFPPLKGRTRRRHADARLRPERRTALIEVHEVRRSHTRVRRFEGKLSASFPVEPRPDSKTRYGVAGAADSGSRRRDRRSRQHSMRGYWARPTGTLDHALRRTLGGASREERDPRAIEGGRAALGELSSTSSRSGPRKRSSCAGLGHAAAERDRVAGALPRHASPCRSSNDEDGDDDDRDPPWSATGGRFRQDGPGA